MGNFFKAVGGIAQGLLDYGREQEKKAFQLQMMDIERRNSEDVWKERIRYNRQLDEEDRIMRARGAEAASEAMRMSENAPGAGAALSATGVPGMGVVGSAIGSMTPYQALRMKGNTPENQPYAYQSISDVEEKIWQREGQQPTEYQKQYLDIAQQNAETARIRALKGGTQPKPPTTSETSTTEAQRLAKANNLLPDYYLKGKLPLTKDKDFVEWNKKIEIARNRTDATAAHAKLMLQNEKISISEDDFQRMVIKGGYEKSGKGYKSLWDGFSKDSGLSPEQIKRLRIIAEGYDKTARLEGTLYQQIKEFLRKKYPEKIDQFRRQIISER